MRFLWPILLSAFVVCSLAACTPVASSQQEVAPQSSDALSEAQPAMAEGETMLVLSIDGDKIPVRWENNESVVELQKEACNSPLVIHASPYGGFEQVGSLGKEYPSRDVSITTQCGDIVLYAGSNIVLFYGSNTWPYTRLGRIDLPDEDVVALLDGEGLSFTLTAE